MLLFSHQVALFKSVVPERTPVTLDWKNTPGENWSKPKSGTPILVYHS